MAIYRTGTAAMAANGVITGKDTKWQTGLSLVRVGSTIVFLRETLKLATISAIVSDTEMRAVDNDGVAVADGAYAILLSDSLTVDGLAQDIAETLRYYQSQETAIGELTSQIQGYVSAASNSASAAKNSETNAGTQATNSANSAKASSDSAAAAKASETNAGTYASNASGSASAASTSASNAKTSETNAGTQATNAANSAKAASDSAAAAKNSETNAATTLSTAALKAQNLNDLANKSTAWVNLVTARTAATARSDLGLGTAATFAALSGDQNSDALAGKLWAWGGTIKPNSNALAVRFASSNTPALGAATGNSKGTIEISNGNNNSAGAMMSFVRDGNFGTYFGLEAGQTFFHHGGWSDDGKSYRFWSQKNTTVDASGFIKQASPIVRLANSADDAPANIGQGEFDVFGLYATNSESEGCVAERTGTGQYEVTGSAGLASEGWQVGIPQDNNGNRLFFADVSQDGDKLIISVHKRKFDVETAMVIAGDPMDIPAGTWLDLRVDMPEGCIYQQKMEKAKQNLILQQQAEGVDPTVTGWPEVVMPDDE